VTQSENKCSSYEYRHDIAFSSWTEMRWAAFKFFYCPTLLVAYISENYWSSP